MRRYTLTFWLLCIAICTFAQHYQVDTLYKTGPQNNRINVVILGDGFTEAEMPKFDAEARKFADFFRSFEPFDRYRDYFNFFTIRTPSKESGITNPGTAADAYPDQPVEMKDTFFGVSFGSYVHRLMTIGNLEVYHALLKSHFPNHDLVIMLGNSSFSGGSGGSVAIFTLHEASNQIGRHEVGHTFGGLADESWNDAVFGRESPNMTSEAGAGPVKWHNWLNHSLISIYKYGSDGEASNWCHPSPGECAMGYLDKTFCAVCAEAIVERIFDLVNPVDHFTPNNAKAINLDADQIFKLGLVRPAPNSLQTEWRLNGALVADNTDHILLKPDEVSDRSVLTATVFDSTSMSRKDNARESRTRTISWSLRSLLPAELKVGASKNIVCAGDTVTLTAYSCPGKITWSNGKSGSTVMANPSQTTVYSASCEVSGKPVMQSETSISVFPRPNAVANNGGPYTPGATIELHAIGGSKYEWAGPRLFFADTPEATIRHATLNNAGVYQVKATDDNGCSKTVMTEVKIDPILSVAANEENWVKVFPNPVKDRISVVTILSGESCIGFYDQAGRQFWSTHFQSGIEITIDMPSGIYTYRFTNGDKEISGKIIVE
jgi:hypothetical protein